MLTYLFLDRFGRSIYQNDQLAEYFLPKKLWCHHFDIIILLSLSGMIIQIGEIFSFLHEKVWTRNTLMMW